MAARVSRKRADKPKRYRNLRDDAKLGPAARQIEKAFGLPTGCVHLVLPGGRKARSDASVASLRESWNK